MLLCWSNDKLSHKPANYTPRFDYGGHQFLGTYGDFTLWLNDNEFLEGKRKPVHDCDNGMAQSLVFLDSKRNIAHTLYVPPYMEFYKLNNREALLKYRYWDAKKMYILDCISMVESKKDILELTDIEKLDYLDTKYDGHYLTLHYLEDNKVYYGTENHKEPKKAWIQIFDVKKESVNKQRKTIEGKLETSSYGEPKYYTQLLKRDNTYICYSLSSGLMSCNIRFTDDKIEAYVYNNGGFKFDGCNMSCGYMDARIQYIENTMIVPAFVHTGSDNWTDSSGHSHCIESYGHKVIFYTKDSIGYFQLAGVMFGYTIINSYGFDDEICFYNSKRKELIIIPKKNIPKMFNDDYQFNINLEGNQRVQLNAFPTFIVKE
jgi:hypothetical protein